VKWRAPENWRGFIFSHSRGLTELGLLAYLLTIPAGPTLVAWGRELPLLAILAGIVLARVPLPESPKPAPFRLLIPLVLFLLSTLLSTLFSELPGESLARAAYAPIGFLLFLATQEVVVTLGAYRRIFLVFTGVVLLLGLDGTYQFWTGTSLLGGNLPFRGRITGSLPHPNDLALIPILLPAALTLLAQNSRAWTGRVIFFGLPFAFATVILSQSRNAWLGLAVGFGTLVACGSRRKPLLAVMALAAMLFALAYALGIGNTPDRVRKILETPHEPRIGHWLVAWQMFKESPLLGKGIHTFGEFYIPYLKKVQLPAGITPEITYIPWAHNIYLEVLAERGILGAVGFGAPLFGMLFLLRRFLRRDSPREPRIVAVGLTASLLGFLAQGFFDLTFLKDWVLLVFWLLAALVARLDTLKPAYQA
jgi:O-antigen ligase